MEDRLTGPVRPCEGDRCWVQAYATWWYGTVVCVTFGGDVTVDVPVLGAVHVPAHQVDERIDLIVINDAYRR